MMKIKNWADFNLGKYDLEGVDTSKVQEVFKALCQRIKDSSQQKQKETQNNEQPEAQPEGRDTSRK